MDLIVIDGHNVDPRKLDRFYNGSDGSRVTDEQWDEEKRRLETNGAGVEIPISFRPLDGDTIAGYD